MDALEDTGLTPADPGFYPAARAQPSSTWASSAAARSTSPPTSPPAASPTSRSSSTARPARSIRDAERGARPAPGRRATTARSRPARRRADVEGIDHELVRRVATWELRGRSRRTTGENVFAMMRRIGQAKAALAADYAAQLARSVGKVVFFAKHIDVMDAAEETFAQRGIRLLLDPRRPDADESGRRHRRVHQRPRRRRSSSARSPRPASASTCRSPPTSCSPSSRWTDAEQTQAIDRVHRIGQDEPVTAWRIIAAQTIDARIAELIDAKAGLAARALDGSDEEVSTSADVQLEALVALLTDALAARAEADPKP